LERLRADVESRKHLMTGLRGAIDLQRNEIAALKFRKNRLITERDEAQNEVKRLAPLAHAAADIDSAVSMLEAEIAALEKRVPSAEVRKAIRGFTCDWNYHHGDSARDGCDCRPCQILRWLDATDPGGEPR
jgi:uncharacterized protein YoxC